MDKHSFIEYQDKVMDYLEYIGYSDLVIGFEPSDVAKSLFKATVIFYQLKISVRTAALMHFGLTWKYQIIPSTKGLKAN